jgi:F0F1-type ATP synthase assembly protein I
MGPKRDDGPSAWRLSGLGMELGGVIGVFTYGGWKLDEKYGTGPLWTFVGLGLALIGGTYNILKVSRRYFNDSDSKSGTTKRKDDE